MGWFALALLIKKADSPEPGRGRLFLPRSLRTFFQDGWSIWGYAGVVSGGRLGLRDLVDLLLQLTLVINAVLDEHASHLAD